MDLSYSDTIQQLSFSNLNADPGIKLHVNFLHGENADHPWRKIDALQFQWSVCNFLFGVDWHLFRKMLNPKYVFVVAGWHRPSLWFIVLCLGWFRRKYFFWSDTLQNQRPRFFAKAWLRQKIADYIFRTATGIFGTGNVGMRVVPRNWMSSGETS